MVTVLSHVVFSFLCVTKPTDEGGVSGGCVSKARAPLYPGRKEAPHGTDVLERGFHFTASAPGRSAPSCENISQYLVDPIGSLLQFVYIVMKFSFFALH